MVGGTRFYDRREVKDILAYLRLLANPADEVSARRVVNVPKRGMGATSVVRLAAWAAANGRSLGRRPGATPRRPASRARPCGGPASSTALLAELREAMGRLAPGELVQLVAERTGYLAELVAERSHEADGRIENMAELVGVAGEYEELSELLETVALVSDSDELDADGARVSLMTLHTAKGLEFPAVFLVGLEDGIFPHFRALGEPGGARGGATALLRGHHPGPPLALPLPRLGADAVGPHLPQHPEPVPGRGPRRARAPTWGSWARRAAPARAGIGRRRAGRGTVFGAGRGTGRASGVRRGPGPRQSTGAEGLGLVAGEAVVHDHWGEGVVVAANGEGERAQATVRFASVGEKRLLLSATPLRRA